MGDELTEKQEKRLAELVTDAEAHGFESIKRGDLHIRFRPEARPGRGHDVSVLFADSDNVLWAYVDVYGNGPQGFGTADWICDPEDQCSACDEAESQEQQ